MKNLFLTAVFLLFGFGVFAQTVEEQFPGNAKAAKVAETAIAKNLNDKAAASRTTWLANRPKDNWFISLEGGANMFVGEGIKKDYDLFKDRVDFPNQLTVGGALGKWFSPVWGLRISGATGTVSNPGLSPRGTWDLGGLKSKYTTNGNRVLNGNPTNTFTYSDLTLDFMLNLKNLFATYKPKGFFDPVVYVGVGTIRTWGSAEDNLAKDILTLWMAADQNKGVNGIQNMVTKGGLQLNFRLADPLQLYLAAEGLFVPDNFNRLVGGRPIEGVASVKLGLTYRFGFRHFIKANFVQEQPVIIEKLVEQACPPIPVCPPCPEPVVVQNVEQVVDVTLDPVFFLIDKSVVRDSELPKVAAAAAYLNNNPNVKLTLKGFADKKTGTSSYNMQLSKKRVDAVAKILVDKFGINKNRLELAPYGDTVQPFTENAKNRVTMFVK